MDQIAAGLGIKFLPDYLPEDRGGSAVEQRTTGGLQGARKNSPRGERAGEKKSRLYCILRSTHKICFLWTMYNI